MVRKQGSEHGSAWFLKFTKPLDEDCIFVCQKFRGIFATRRRLKDKNIYLLKTKILVAEEFYKVIKHIIMLNV